MSGGRSTRENGSIDRRSVIVGAMSAAIAACGGCSGGGPKEDPSQTLVVDSGAAAPTDSFGKPSNIALRSLCARRAAALMSGDERTFLADLDPRNQSLIAQQTILLRNIKQFPTTLITLAPGEILSQDATTGAFHLRVQQVIRLTVDTGPPGVGTAEPCNWTIILRDGRWIITNIVYGGAVAPWSLSPLTVSRGGNAWLAGDHSVPELSSLGPIARAQAAYVEKLWGDRPRYPGYVMFFTREETAYKSWYGNSTGDWSEGVTPLLTYTDQAGRSIEGDAPSARVVVSLGRIEKLGYASQGMPLVLRHELVHAITARTEGHPAVEADLGDDIIRWSTEGFARFIEFIDQPELQRNRSACVRDGVRRGFFTGVPPASKTFYSSNRIDFNYMVSSTVFEFIHRRKNLATAVQFYDDVHRLTDLPGRPVLTSAVFEDACSTAVGLSASQFLQAWSRYVRSI